MTITRRQALTGLLGPAALLVLAACPSGEIGCDAEDLTPASGDDCPTGSPAPPAGTATPGGGR